MGYQNYLKYLLNWWLIKSMSLALFSTRNLYHRNGKTNCKPRHLVVYENSEQSCRRRTLRCFPSFPKSALKQILLCETANVVSGFRRGSWCGLHAGYLPENWSVPWFRIPQYFFIDSDTYEMYRDFQENTINSDGSFGMWIAYIAAIYLAHEMYNYFLPWYWNRTAPCKNGEEQRVRMRDALASTLLE